MVRVFSIYQFDGQTIHRIPGDIRSASLIDANDLALAKSDHIIEILSLQNSNFDTTKKDTFSANPADDSNTQIKYAFPTMDEVVEMVYCKFGKKIVLFSPFFSLEIAFATSFLMRKIRLKSLGNYIATIEQKVSNSGTVHSFCRVYTNWWNCKSASNENLDDIYSMTCNVTIRARIAGRVTPSTNNINCLEVIEIPTIGNCLIQSWNIFSIQRCKNFLFIFLCGQTVRSNQNQSNTYLSKLAICQRTGTLICAKDRTLKIYKFDECVNENTHFKYIDFIEVPFEIELDFVPTQLSINEHIVGCANDEFMCIFKISEQNFYNTANSLTTSSEMSVMAAMPVYTEHPTDAVLDYGNVSKRFLSSITSNIFSTFDHHTMDSSGERAKYGRDRSIDLKPSFLDNGIPLCNLRHFTSANDEVCGIWHFFHF